MKKINWIIEKNLYPEYENKLIKIIKDSGNEVILIDYDFDFIFNRKEKLLNKFNDNDIVITYGSIELNKKILKNPLYPGSFLTLDNYECSKYYGYYGNNLLNSNYCMMGLNDVLRNKEKLFSDNNKIFIRPSNGYKSFTGQCLNKNNFNYEFNKLCKSYGGLEPETLVLISPYQEINEEWRFVIIDGEVISGSLYMDNQNRKEWSAYYDKTCNDDKAFDYAKKMVEKYQPDKAYTIDICKTSNGDYKLIEINSLCSSSLYGNNYKDVIYALNDLCVKEWKELWEI